MPKTGRTRSKSSATTGPNVQGIRKGKKAKKSKSKQSRSKTAREKTSSKNRTSASKLTDKKTQSSTRTSAGNEPSGGSKKNSQIRKVRSKNSQGSKIQQKSGNSKKFGGLCCTGQKSKSEKSKSQDPEKAQIRKMIPTEKRRGPSESQSSGEIEKPLWICSYWPRAASKRNVDRIIAIVRSAERVDRIFGSDWLKTEAPHGYLLPTDLNVPNNSLIRKFHEDGLFIDNPPITPFGKYYTLLTARALCNRGVTSKQIFCSPTFRSIQTGESLAKFLKAKLAIEPGLIEPLAWYRGVCEKLPDFHIEELANVYPIDTRYSPFVTMETLSKLFEKESEIQGLKRVDFVLRTLAGEQRSESLIVVGHAITLAVAVELSRPQTNEENQGLSGPQPSTSSSEWHGSLDMMEGDVIDRVNLGLRFPPGSAIALHQVNKEPPYLYQLCPEVVPPLSYGELYSSRPITETTAG